MTTVSSISDYAKTILATFPRGCVAYEEHMGSTIVWGVRRCETHFETKTLPPGAEKYFGLRLDT
jgi:hypothetical protein